MGDGGGDRDGAAEGPGEPATPTPSAAPDKGAGFGLNELVTLYGQQTTTVNQLWAMFAATTFAAGAFAITVAEGRSKWLLAAGAAGFLFFAWGHIHMVITAVTRQEKTRLDIAGIVGPEDPASPYPGTLRHLAGQEVSKDHARNVHLAIDLCVFVAFGLAALFG
jgi:hypothetical protein